MDFARDLGYLDKFLSGLTQHAATLPPAQGTRLKELMSEEATRWAEIKRLLAGEVPASHAHQQPTPPSAMAPVVKTPEPTRSAGLTVGSLLGVPKK